MDHIFCCVADIIRDLRHCVENLIPHLAHDVNKMVLHFVNFFDNRFDIMVPLPDHAMDKSGHPLSQCVDINPEIGHNVADIIDVRFEYTSNFACYLVHRVPESLCKQDSDAEDMSVFVFCNR